MLNKVTLILGLCALITACSERQDQGQAVDVVEAVAPATGPLTVRALDGVEIGTALIQDYVNYDLASAMQSAGIPIRCINAEKWPTNVEANRKYADFDAVILTGFGHFLMQEATDELNRLLIETVTNMNTSAP